MTVDIEKLKVLALAAKELFSDEECRFNPSLVLELIAEVERLRARFEYIEDNATTHGGGHGFMVSFFVPEDNEDIGCGIDATIEAHTKAAKEQG